jgi:site-specific DNA recombinase
MMSRAAVYVRISQDSSGRAAGVRRQEKEIREYADAHGWDIVGVFKDNDVKANARSRPGLDKLCAAIRAGEVDRVVAWKDDRLLRGGRSKRALDFLLLVTEHRTTCSFVRGDDWDFSTAQGRMMVDIRLAIAGYEVESAGERQVSRWRQRKEDGKLSTLGRRPFGLRRDGEQMVEVPAEADAIRDAVRQLIAGASLYSVTRGLAEADLQSPCKKDCDREHPHYFRAAHFKRALMSDHLVRYGVLDADQHRLVVARLEAAPKRKVGRPRRSYLLSGIAVCGACGSKMGASSGAYHCQAVKCGKVGVKTVLADEVVVRALQARQPAAQEALDAEASPTADADAPVFAELAEIEDRIAELADNLALSETVLARRVRALETRRDELVAQLGRPKTRYDWLRAWAAAGFPEPDPAELHDEAVELIASVTIAPAKVRGTKIFDADRVQIAFREMP